ncbi:hypothetical protein Ciccas_007937 [Cichlidogyrus casuarinus]|uniref:C2H2-type domain-containing protein n=1 Tax=Cichlidogyrus casuarinus TaxID=1844966 RepID=A0ABD2Q1F6_9PLAT
METNTIVSSYPVADEKPYKPAKGRPRKHPQQQHVNPKYVCQVCSHVCLKPSILEKHIRAHTDERPFPCDHCGMRFKTVSNLNKHQKSLSHLHFLQNNLVNTRYAILFKKAPILTFLD